MNKVVVEDYYHMTIVNENMNWMKSTHLLSSISLNLKAPFVYLPLLQEIE